MPAGGAYAESEAIAAELAERLSEAIGQLPAREAEVFCLCYFEDFSNQQIADILGMSAGAVGAALCKARAKLVGFALASPRRKDMNHQSCMSGSPDELSGELHMASSI